MAPHECRLTMKDAAVASKSPPPAFPFEGKAVEDSAPEGWVALRNGTGSILPPVFYCDDEKIPYPRLKDADVFVGGLDEAVPKLQMKLPWLDCIKTIANGQNVVQAISLSILVNVEGTQTTNTTLLPLVYFFVILCSEYLFLSGVLQNVEMMSKVTFFYGCLRHGIVLDFANLSGYVPRHRSAIAAVILALSGTYLIWAGARGTGWAGIMTRIPINMILLYNCYRLYIPWQESDTMEQRLIALPKLMEKDPTLARELLSKCKVQSESVTVARLSDILNIQRMARLEAVKDYVKRHNIEFDRAESTKSTADVLLFKSKSHYEGHPVVSWLQKKKHGGDHKAAKEDVAAFTKEIYDAGAKFAFSWNQLYTSLPEGVDDVLPSGNPLMIGSMALLIEDATKRQTWKLVEKDVDNITEGKLPSINSTTSPKELPDYVGCYKRMDKFRLPGKWTTALSEIHFLDETVEKFSGKISSQAEKVVLFSGFVFLFSMLLPFFILPA